MKKTAVKMTKGGLCAAGLLICSVLLSISAQAANQHVEEVTKGTYTYQVKIGGTLDEFNTANYLETYLASMRLQSRFQPNESVTIENIGSTDVVNPRIVINGRRNRFSVDDILADIIKPGMTDGEKAQAIWSYVADIWLQTHENDRRVDNGSILINHELANPVKLSNVYYCSGCQFASANILVLCKYIGLKARTSGMGSAHRISEVWFDNDWHILDGDQRTFYLEKDNKTLASYDDIKNDPNLAHRTIDGGFASRGIKSRGEQYKTLERKNIDINDIKPYLSTMAMTLRPGEKFVWRWDNIGKYRCGDNDRNIKRNRPAGLMPYQLANGKMIYQPKLQKDIFPQGAAENANIKSVGDANQPMLQPKKTGTPAYVTYKITTAYPVVGGTLTAKFHRKTAGDVCRILVSVRDGNSVQAWSAADTDIGDFEKRIELDKILNPLPSPAIYNYSVKIELLPQGSPQDVAVSSIGIESDIQMSALSLPSLSVGTNNVAYRVDSTGDHKVRITHLWKENSMIIPPLPPKAAVKPANGSSTDLKPLKNLRWEAATDPDGYISDYHVQLSTRPDMLYPVSPNFDRIIGSPEPQWDVPTGWLLPYKTYYWRVRSRDNWGVWSDWSDVWKFETTVPAPGSG